MRIVVNKTTNNQLTDLDIEVLQAVIDYGPIGCPGVSEAKQLDRDKVSQSLKKLFDLGKITRIITTEDSIRTFTYEVA